ncbi:MAG: hypothetical protein EOO14_00330 [Chitinophagaceae bacterium]|nr:MAG: hypothetical protein EOO14_00330 [Chitinophagaceae bacterium]
MRNAYPDKPLVPYKQTTVQMALVIKSIAALLVPVEIKRALYVFFRIESANGHSGVNNNYFGIQADSGRWQTEYDALISGVCKKAENGTGKERLFCTFRTYEDCLKMMASRFKGRGLYVGGTTHKIVQMTIKTPTDLAVAYKREWVKGRADYQPTKEEITNFLSMYHQAESLFV